MFELFLFSGLLAFVLPVALLAGMAYLFFWVVSAVLKTAGAVVGTVVALVFCMVALGCTVLFGIACLPLMIFH